MAGKPEVKALVAQLEAYVDSKYQASRTDDPPALSPEIERFLKDLDLGS